MHDICWGLRFKSKLFTFSWKRSTFLEKISEGWHIFWGWRRALISIHCRFSVPQVTYMNQNFWIMTLHKLYCIKLFPHINKYMIEELKKLGLYDSNSLSWTSWQARELPLEHPWPLPRKILPVMKRTKSSNNNSDLCVTSVLSKHVKYIHVYIWTYCCKWESKVWRQIRSNRKEVTKQLGECEWNVQNMPQWGSCKLELNPGLSDWQPRMLPLSEDYITMIIVFWPPATWYCELIGSF